MEEEEECFFNNEIHEDMAEVDEGTKHLADVESIPEEVEQLADKEENVNNNSKTNFFTKKLADSIPIPKPLVPKKVRGITGYMLFLKENREAIKSDLIAAGVKPGIKEVVKTGGERWNQLSLEEKTIWNKKASEVPVVEKPVKNSTEDDLCTPVTRVREIMKKDSDVRKVSGDAVRLLAKASDYFIEQMVQASLDCSDKKKIKLIDVHHVIHAEDRYQFLSQDFETPASIVFREEREKKLTKLAQQKKEQTVMATGKNSITSYFSSHQTFSE